MVHSSAADALRIVQVLVYATPVSVITAEAQADYDAGHGAVWSEVTQFHVATDKGIERIDAVQYAAAIDVDASVQRPHPMLPRGHQRDDRRDREQHGAGVQPSQPSFRLFRIHDRV